MAVFVASAVACMSAEIETSLTWLYASLTWLYALLQPLQIVLTVPDSGLRKGWRHPVLRSGGNSFVDVDDIYELAVANCNCRTQN